MTDLRAKLDELQKLYESVGYPDPGNEKHEAFESSAYEYMPKLIAIARAADYFINIPDYAEGTLHKRVALRDALAALEEIK